MLFRSVSQSRYNNITTTTTIHNSDNNNNHNSDNDLKRRTIDNKVKESTLTLQNLTAEILLKGSQRKVNEEQAKAIQQKYYKDGKNLLKKEKRSLFKEIRWKPMHKT